LSCAGEVLTNDEVAQRLEEADRVRKAAKKKKKGKASTAKQISQTDQDETVDMCESCGQEYSEEEAEYWIGCDACESWWHYWCGGLQSMLTG